MTVIGSGRPMASANMRRCRSWAAVTGLASAVSRRSPYAGHPRGWAAGHGLVHEQAGCPAQALAPGGGHRPRHGDQAQVGAADPAVLDKAGDDAPRGRVHRHGHAQADARHGRVDADHARVRVGQRATGIPRVQRRVGLDHVLDHAATGRQRPAKRADHAGGHRARQPERVADRHHQLADHEPVGLAELGGCGHFAAGADHGQVGQGVGADNRKRRGGAVGERRGAAHRAAHHVRVGEQETITGEHHGGAQALARPAPAGNPQAGNLGCDAFCDAGDDPRVGVQRVTVCHDYKITSQSEQAPRPVMIQNDRQGVTRNRVWAAVAPGSRPARRRCPAGALASLSCPLHQYS